MYQGVVPTPVHASKLGKSNFHTVECYSIQHDTNLLPIQYTEAIVANLMLIHVATAVKYVHNYIMIALHCE